jgi:hypothetical protein
VHSSKVGVLNENYINKKPGEKQGARSLAVLVYGTHSAEGSEELRTHTPTLQHSSL